MADFPRIKHITEDGRTIPVAETQHFTGVGDETVRTGEKNPLPTKDLQVRDKLDEVKNVIIANKPKDVQGVKDADVKAELELIKQGIADNKATNDLILARLDNPIDTQLTGSNVEEAAIISNGVIAAGITKSYEVDLVELFERPVKIWGIYFEGAVENPAPSGTAYASLNLKGGGARQSDNVEIKSLARSANYPSTHSLNLITPRALIDIKNNNLEMDISAVKIIVWAFTGGVY